MSAENVELFSGSHSSFDEMVSSGKISTKFFRNLKWLVMIVVIEWCMNDRLISSKYECSLYKKDMHLLGCKDISDDYEWVC